MTVANSTAGVQGAGISLGKANGWFMATAVAFIFLGIFAIVEPGIAGLAITILAGWLLIFGGVAHLIGLFGGGTAGHLIWRGLIGALYIVTGFYLVAHPLIGLTTLTAVLAGIILAEGVLEVMAYFQTHGMRGSGWLLLNAVITLLLSGLIWFHWPWSSSWAIGTLVGVNLLMTGISRLMFGMAARRAVYLTS